MRREDRLAELLPAYDIGEELGRGAFGVVVRAEHRGLRRQVAVKQLWLSLTADATAQHRFTAEARVLAAMDHPHIVQIYDFVEQDDVCLFVMELLPGGTLRDRAATTGVSAQGATSLAIAACGALHYAHERGVLHRDVKPDNMMFNAAGILRVTDFGIAKVLGATSTLQTAAGAVVGTPAYMAPEQASGGRLTPATDVYALGTVLYELLAGRFPFEPDENAFTVLYQHVHERPLPLGETARHVPGPVAAAVMRALEPDPAQRYADAEEFGIVLADAARAAWGSGWVGHGGEQVIASGRIAAHLSAPPPAADLTSPGTAATGAGAQPTVALPGDPRLARGPATLGDGRAAGPAGRRRGLVVGLAVVAAAALGLGAWLAFGRSGGGPSTSSSLASSSSQTPSPSPQPTPTPGRRLLADPMTSPATGWVADSGQQGVGDVSFRVDGMHVTVLKGLPPLNTFSVASPVGSRVPALTVTASLGFVTAARADAAGVRCDQGGRTGLRYSFEIHPDGTWLISRLDSGGAHLVQQGGGIPGVAPFRVTGTCIENAAGDATTLTLTVNEKRLATVRDTHPAGPIAWHAALVVARDLQSAGTEVRFADVEIVDPRG